MPAQKPFPKFLLSSAEKRSRSFQLSRIKKNGSSRCTGGPSIKQESRARKGIGAASELSRGRGVAIEQQKSHLIFQVG